MKTITAIAGGLLGLAFIVFGLNFFLNFIPMGGGPPEGSPPALFFGAVGPTGFMAFVKVCEILGGVLVAIPKTRNLGLLVLGPIILNILAFHIFIGSPSGLLDPPVIAISVLGAFLLIAAKDKFAKLLN
ncbi:hypothetical protein SAMN02745181_3862 [Rubritalea squalenifaciens DSM 18772]|uniref:DoxX-like family protein n=1 Tax=Rubritalea squalenifaciens DSM 18772 TaxID=1123071 RepID=A0A1M6SQB1_9BACT|nr:hypothetical protein [Rubritalea squalenifaciens]SHK46931.1 hypothetical protein SAMN02745181_3862 [Rubritalea squalenifaciens DSM 18772]